MSLPTHNPMTPFHYECGHSVPADGRDRDDGEMGRLNDHLFLKNKGVDVGPWLCPACRKEAAK